MILQEKSKTRLKFLKTMGTTGKVSIILASFSNYLSVIFSCVTWYSMGVSLSLRAALSIVMFGDFSRPIGLIGILAINCYTCNNKKNLNRKSYIFCMRWAQFFDMATCDSGWPSLLFCSHTHMHGLEFLQWNYLLLLFQKMHLRIMHIHSEMRPQKLMSFCLMTCQFARILFGKIMVCICINCTNVTCKLRKYEAFFFTHFNKLVVMNLKWTLR